MTATIAVLSSAVFFLGTVGAMTTGEKSLLAAAESAARNGESAKAVKILDAVIEQSPQPIAYYLRGREHFRLGKIDQSLKDFDKYIQLRPDRRARLWERGIACYYAKQFTQGADQFAQYQTFHSEDVENAVWHFLCLSRAEGIDKAKQSLLTVRHDDRVPMMKVYDLFAGKATPGEVIAEAQRAPENRRDQADFFAHLYLGLYFEAVGEQAKAQRYIEQAANKHAAGGYMGDVARVHAAWLKQRPQSDKKDREQRR